MKAGRSKTHSSLSLQSVSCISYIKKMDGCVHHLTFAARTPGHPVFAAEQICLCSVFLESLPENCIMSNHKRCLLWLLILSSCWKLLLWLLAWLFVAVSQSDTLLSQSFNQSVHTRADWSIFNCLFLLSNLSQLHIWPNVHTSQVFSRIKYHAALLIAITPTFIRNNITTLILTCYGNIVTINCKCSFSQL